MSNEKNELTIKIETTQGTWEATFKKTDKVQEVIQAVIGHFGYSPDGKYELRLESNPDEVLKPERPLVSYGIKDGDILVFTDLGVAV
ncbi:MAG: hypothetical protein HY776_05330 [Actinobacteria bacterium]|nr:hypothetical protein [Actinomycetota bacterium]